MLFTKFATAALVGWLGHASGISPGDGPVAPPLSPLESLRQAWGEPMVPFVKTESRAHDQVGDFRNRVRHLVGSHRFSLHVVSGYSGADYADKELFRSRFLALIYEAYGETKRRLGADAKTVIQLGGTVDGLGVGYAMLVDSIIPEIRKDIVVIGMVADQAVKYHLDGVREGYDVIAPQNQALLLFPTFIDGDKNQSWQMKAVARGASQTVFSMMGFDWASYAKMHLLEGGEIAFQEALELLVEARRVHRPSSLARPELELHLYLGHVEGKFKRMKGFKAATQMALLLEAYPELRPSNLRVKFSLETHTGYQAAELPAWITRGLNLDKDPHSLLDRDIEASWPEAEVDARVWSFRKAVSTSVDAAIRQIEDGIWRTEEDSAVINRALSQANHPQNGARATIERAEETVILNNRLVAELNLLRETLASSGPTCEGNFLKSSQN